MKIVSTAMLVALFCARLAVGADTAPTDIQMPGTQPNEVSTLESPNKCDNCHGGYNSAVEPAHNWRGSMMAHAGRDPIFWATMAIAEQDFDGSGDLCLRCHSTSGWLAGRSTPTDGSGLAAGDSDGVECDYCHKLTKPDDSEHLGVMNDPFIANDGEVPAEGYYGSGMGSLWGGADKLGPYNDADARHQFMQSDFHRDPEFCGTCHDVSNPVTGDLAPKHGTLPGADGATASGLPGGLVDGKAAFNNPPYRYGIVERTFSEHMSSPLSTIAVDDFRNRGLPAGGAFEAIYLAATGNESRSADYAAPYRQRTYTCQTCHMRPVIGTGANKHGVPLRHDLPLHDMTGGNYWMADAIAYLDGQDKLRLGGGLTTEMVAALRDGALRAREQLQLAATLEVVGDEVKIINHTGHKLITGYPEGRRMWLNVKWYNDSGSLLREDGAYGELPGATGLAGVTPKSIIDDPDDTNLHVFEAHMGMSKAWAEQLLSLGYGPGLVLAYDRLTNEPAATLGELASGASADPVVTFHFALNDSVESDNRIPPFEMAYDEALRRNALPVPNDLYGGSPGGTFDNYAEIALDPPSGAVSATIDLLYQPTSWEYIQFLYLANAGDNAFLADEGTNILDAWASTGMAAPMVMTSATWGATPPNTSCLAPTPTLDNATADTNSVTLDWTALDGVASYGVFYDQSDKSQAIDTVACSAPGSCSFTDGGLQQGQSYCYKLTAWGEDTEGTACQSGFGNVLCASPTPVGQSNTAGVASIATGSWVTTGKGNTKTEEYLPATSFSAGETIIIRLHIEDEAGSAVAGAVAQLNVEGPETAALSASPSGSDGVAEAAWSTEAPRKNGRGGTTPGSYTITVSGLDSQSHEWDGVATGTTITVQ